MPLEGIFENVATSSNVDERQPLLSVARKHPAAVTSAEDSISAPDADLRVILPALMVCAFLAAFDTTVVAAIYPIM